MQFFIIFITLSGVPHASTFKVYMECKIVNFQTVVDSRYLEGNKVSTDLKQASKSFSCHRMETYSIISVPILLSVVRGFLYSIIYLYLYYKLARQLNTVILSINSSIGFKWSFTEINENCVNRIIVRRHNCVKIM